MKRITWIRGISCLCFQPCDRPPNIGRHSAGILSLN